MFIYKLIVLFVMIIHSQAFPPQVKPAVTSRIHKLLQNHSLDSEITFRKFQKEDLGDLMALHQQWFPIKYSKSFYSAIMNGNAKCTVAVTKIITYEDLQQKQKTQEIIVGVIVYQLTNSKGYLAKISYWQYIEQFTNSLYIMTLGVIDQYRKKGVATQLINYVLQQAKKSQQLKLIYLHVIGYNESALKFYSKNQFQVLQKLQKYYDIQEQKYDGYALGMLINEGKLRKTWGQWFKNFFKRNQQIQQ